MTEYDWKFTATFLLPRNAVIEETLTLLFKVKQLYQEWCDCRRHTRLDAVLDLVMPVNQHLSWCICLTNGHFRVVFGNLGQIISLILQSCGNND